MVGRKKRRTLKDFQLTEVSLVDKPAMEGAKVLLMKREFGEQSDDRAAELRTDVASFLAANPKNQDALDVFLLSERDRTLLDDEELVTRIEARNFELRERAKLPVVADRLDELQRGPSAEEDDARPSDVLLAELEGLAEQSMRDDETFLDAFRRLESSNSDDRFSQLLRTLRERAA